MDIEKDLEKLIDKYKIEKKLDNIENLLIKKEYSDSSTGLWLFALLAMMYNGFGSTVPHMPTSITNVYQEPEKKEVK